MNLNSAFRLNAVLTSPYTVASSDVVLLCGNGASAITINLPSAATFAGRFLIFKDSGSGAKYNTTIVPSGSQTIDGAANVKLISNREAITLCSDSSNWYIV